MSGIRYIHKLFHEKNASDFRHLYEERLTYHSTVRTGLKIKPMNQSHTYELYYVPTNKMIGLISKIHLVSGRFLEMYKKLPTVAQKQFIHECLVEELYNTNELEGVRSTREEIARSAKEILVNKKSKKRFESMIKLYFRLLNHDIDYPREPQDIRAMYDDITNGEIDLQELPDGEIFRKDTTYVLKKSGTGKVVHQGITPEAEIVRIMEQLLAFINERDDIPTMIKVAIGHYYFGYMHPFYDGNGRTSRFISSVYLSEELEDISTLSLSRGCNKYKNEYLEAFEITSSIRSSGEMNYFIEVFLEIIAEALDEMSVELKEKSHLLNMAANKLENETALDNKDKKDMMFVLAQNHFFDSSSGLTIKELSEIFSKSEATIRKVAKELLAASFIEQKGEKPAYFCVKQQYFQT